jgi:hypothetical protein
LATVLAFIVRRAQERLPRPDRQPFLVGVFGQLHG